MERPTQRARYIAVLGHVCVRSVERLLSAVPGVVRVEVHLAGGRAVVEGAALTEALADAIKNQGYGVRVVF
jgi:copper chaperone CopZ